MSLLAATIPMVRRLLDGFRNTRLPIVHVVTTHQPDYADAQWPHWRSHGLTSDGQALLLEGSWGAQIVDELTPRRGEYVVAKKGYGGFANPALNTILRFRGVTTCAVAGITTAICVSSTIRGGVEAESPTPAWPTVPAPAPSSATPTPAPTSKSPTTLTGRAIKVTVMLNAAEILEVPVIDGKPRVQLNIAAGGRMLKTDLAAKSVRKAISVIREHGMEGVACILQGKLGVGDRIEEAGLAVQPKVKRATAVDANG
jgi:hypothetical protein